jgi:hypothetical protein
MGREIPVGHSNCEPRGRFDQKLPLIEWVLSEFDLNLEKLSRKPLNQAVFLAKSELGLKFEREDTGVGWGYRASVRSRDDRRDSVRTFEARCVVAMDSITNR